MQNKILITGVCGMIGSKLAESLLSMGYEVVGVDCMSEAQKKINYTHIQTDLGNKDNLIEALKRIEITHIIHLAALAHTTGVDDLSWEHYKYINVTCAENVFSIASEKNIPILFSSTADVYGITKGIVDVDYPRKPIGNYAKSKCLAEDSLRKMCEKSSFTIMRFSPVYTSTQKRDIQKRYYLKYPNIAYRVGEGAEYEVLDIECLVKNICDWVEKPIGQQIINVKDVRLMKTSDIIKKEKEAGRAKFVIKIPKWIMVCLFKICRIVSPMGWKTYMLSKIVNPLRTR